MIGLTSLEACNSVFNITEENNDFELYTDTFDEFSITELKDEFKEILSFSDITPKNIQHKIIGLLIFQAYRKDQKSQALIVFLYYYWVLLDNHFKNLKFNWAFRWFGWKNYSIDLKTI